MGFGLGKNTPIVLSLGKSNYDALILRHGQWCRWRTAKKCTCVTTANEPDIHCEKCGGAGDVYDYQREYTDTIRVKAFNSIVELPAECEHCEIIKVYDYRGIVYTATKTGLFVTLSSSVRTLTQGEIVEVVYKNTLVEMVYKIAAQNVGGAFYRIPVETSQPNIEGVYYKAPIDVIGIERLETLEGEPVTITGYRQNCIQVKEDIKTPLIAYGVAYIKPAKFLVQSQSLSKNDLNLVQQHSGDALCTFPYMYNVAENDVITILSGTMTNKIAIAHRSSETDDIIPEFFVAKVTSLETQSGHYTEGIDFILAGTNKIHWAENKPLEGDVMSIVYEYYPTYRVSKNIPTLRTSENQRIPKKVILKLFSAFSESRGVNRNV